jgi:hypothetical protein
MLMLFISYITPEEKSYMDKRNSPSGVAWGAKALWQGRALPNDRLQTQPDGEYNHEHCRNH